MKEKNVFWLMVAMCSLLTAAVDLCRAALTTEDIEATRAIRDHVQQWIGYTAHTTGSYPATIPDSFFPDGVFDSPVADRFSADGKGTVLPGIQIEVHATKEHPTIKLVNTTSSPAYWYNPTTGWFQAKVINEGSTSGVLADYNLLGDFSTPLTSITQVTSGLGSAPFHHSPPVIPEPATAGLVGVGVLVLFRRPSRRRRHSRIR